MKNIIMVFIKWSLRVLIWLVSIIIITGSIVTFWPCDPYVCVDPSIKGIWEAGIWWTFGILVHFLNSFEGIVLLFLIVVFMYNLGSFLCNRFKKYEKNLFNCKK